MTTNAEYVEFLDYIQRLLGRGRFTATYKYALLLSLADLCLEQPPCGRGAVHIPLRTIAARYIEYYWRQAAHYRGRQLRQNPGRQALVISAISEAQREYRTIAKLKQQRDDWDSLVSRVRETVKDQPLHKLHELDSAADQFLYSYDEQSDSVAVPCKIVDGFRRYYGLVHSLVRAAWVDRLTRIKRNRVSEKDDLHRFLFDERRENLTRVRNVLSELQSGRCFYCGSRPRKLVVDHFIPWSEYPWDLALNFVGADARCNSKKNDQLASMDILGEWAARNRAGDLSEAMADSGFDVSEEAVTAVACWAYERAERQGALVWAPPNLRKYLLPSWKAILGC